MQFHGQSCSPTYISYTYQPCCGAMLCSEHFFHFVLEFFCDSTFYFVSIISQSSILELLIPNLVVIVSSEALQCFRSNTGFCRDICNVKPLRKLHWKKFLQVKNQWNSPGVLKIQRTVAAVATATKGKDMLKLLGYAVYFLLSCWDDRWPECVMAAVAAAADAPRGRKSVIPPLSADPWLPWQWCQWGSLSNRGGREMGMGQLSGETCKKIDCIADPSYYPDSIGSKGREELGLR